jgi:hypothetical protein
MSTLRRVANWIDFFVSLIAAVYIFTVVLQMSRGVEHFWRETFTLGLKKSGPAVYAGLFLALLLLLSAILRAVQHLGSATAQRYLEFDTPNGTVAVRAGSVEEVINRTVRDMPEVADASAVLVLPKHAKAPTEARVRCRLYNQPNLLAIQDQVRAVVSQCYLDMFPGQEAVPVRMSVERIIFEPRQGKAAAKTAPEVPEGEEGGAEPMRPQYPVDRQD